MLEDTSINKSSGSKERDICRCWYFFDKGFKFQTKFHNGCHDVLMISMNLSE